MIRKFLLFPFLLLFILFGCEDSSFTSAYRDLDQWMQGNGKVKVLSTVAMIDDIVKEIGGERVDHIPLILGEIDPHTYELVKGDEEKFSNADVIFYNGLGLEHGASLSHRLKVHSSAHALGDAIYKKHPEKIYVIDDAIDPHIWMDISLWKEAAQEVMQVLAHVDTQGAPFYHKRGEVLFEKMDRAHAALIAMMRQIPGEKRYLATSHDAFNYFVRAYFADDEERASGEWQSRFAAPEGIAPDGRLSSVHLQQVISFLMKHQVSVLFPESNVSRDSLKKIAESCRDRGHVVRFSNETLYGDSMGSKTYLEMIEHNGEVIKRELLCQ